MAKKSNGGTDPKKKSYKVKTQSGGSTKVSDKAVRDARANKGAFKERPAYKGKVITNDQGKMSGIKTHDGSYTRTTNPVERHKAKQVLKRDRQLHVKDSTAHSRIIKKFQKAKKI